MKPKLLASLQGPRPTFPASFSAISSTLMVPRRHLPPLPSTDGKLTPTLQSCHMIFPLTKSTYTWLPHACSELRLYIISSESPPPTSHSQVVFPVTLSLYYYIFFIVLIRHKVYKVILIIFPLFVPPALIGYQNIC